MYIGILEESKKPPIILVDAVLYLPGTSYADQSIWQSTVSNFSTQIVNNSFYFDSTIDRMHTDRSPQKFAFGSNNFLLSCDVHITGWNSSNAAVLIGDDSNSPSQSNYAWFIRADQRFQFNWYNSSGTLTTYFHNLPDLDYLSGFQPCKVERVGTSLNFYYKNNLVGTSNIGTGTIRSANVSTSPEIKIGHRLSTSVVTLRGYIKEILVQHPAAGSPP